MAKTVNVGKPKSEREAANLLANEYLAAGEQIARDARRAERGITGIIGMAERGGIVPDVRAGASGTQAPGFARNVRIAARSVSDPAFANLVSLRMLNRRRRKEDYQGQLGGAPRGVSAAIMGGSAVAPPTEPQPVYTGGPVVYG